MDITAYHFQELARNIFAEVREYYKEAAEDEGLDAETTTLFLQDHGMELSDAVLAEVSDGTDPMKAEAYQAAMDSLAFECLRGDAVSLDQHREIVRECLLPDWLDDAKEEEARALRAGQAGKAAFLAALAEGKSRREANDIAIAAAQALRAAEAQAARDEAEAEF